MVNNKTQKTQEKQTREILSVLRKYGVRSTSDIQSKMKSRLNFTTVMELLSELETQQKVERTSLPAGTYWRIK